MWTPTDDDVAPFGRLAMLCFTEEARMMNVSALLRPHEATGWRGRVGIVERILRWLMPLQA